MSPVKIMTDQACFQKVTYFDKQSHSCFAFNQRTSCLKDAIKLVVYIFYVHQLRRWKNFTTSILDAWQFWLFHFFQVFQMHKAHESLIWDSTCIKHKRITQLLTVHTLLLSLKICFVCWILFGYRDRNRANKYCTLKNLNMVKKLFRKSVIQKVSYVMPFLFF